MNEDKIKIKKSSREKNKTKMRSQRLNNYLTKTKNIKKYLTHNNTNILSSNSNLEAKTIKNENINKLNRLNIKNIIKKIDLFSFSCRKNSTSKKTSNKKLIEKPLLNKNNKSNFIQLNLNKFKKREIPKNYIFIKKNSHNKIKKSIKKEINYTFTNATDQANRNKIKNKTNGEKISLSKFHILKFDKDNYNEFDLNSNSDYLINSMNRITTSNHNLYKLIKDDLPFKKGKSHKKEKHISNLKRFENSLTNKNHNKLTRNNTESDNKLNLESIIDSKRRFHRNIIKTFDKDKIERKKNSLKYKKLLININSTNNKDAGNNGNKFDKGNILKKELKNYVLKRKEGNLISPKTIIQKKTKTSSNQKSKKEKFIHKIPKPIMTNNNIVLNMNKFYIKHNYITENTSPTNNNEIKRHFSSDILNGNIQTTKSGIDFSNTKNENFSENYLIDNALINIREYTNPGKNMDGQTKINQDSYIIHRNINYIKNFNIFAIFDGHGFNGQIISEYLKENLVKKLIEHPKIKILKNLRYIYAEFINDNYQIINEIFQEIDNEILHNDKLINTNLSGTTCTLLIQIGDNIICANIGDSKVILVYEDNKGENNNEENDQYNFINLTKDSTPYNKTEKTRIILNGGMIKQLKDSFNQELGPLKIFLKNENIPGLTITRSFGDKIGKSIGLISKPFINEYTLNRNVKYIVMASSGVWKFMKEKELLEYGKDFYLMNDPDNFCKEIANKAAELYEKNSGFIDDITMIVIFFNFL